MNHQISSQDLILHRTSSLADESYSLGSTFTLQDRVEAIEHSSEEFYERVRKEMREKGIERNKAMDSVRLQRLIDVCDTKESTALYLLEDWNYEPQVCRFLKLLCDSGVNLKEVEDFLHNTPLHIAATKNYVSLAKFLIDSYPSMLVATNGQGQLPVEIAIKNGQDDVAAFLIRRMDHRRVGNLFRAKQQRTAPISLVKLTEKLKMQKTIVAVLDCLISPRWPHPPCLPSDIVPCLSWEQLQDTPTHFQVTYDILESDVNGRFPDDAEYEYTPKSCYYNLAKHCQQTLNKEILNHVVIKLLTKRKWEKYAAFWFRFRGCNYLIFLAVLCADFMMAATSSQGLKYVQRSSFFRFLEVWVIAMTVWFLSDELFELKREPLAYIKDVFNYLDLSGYFLILATYLVTFSESNAQWTFASLAILINFIGVFKYSGVDRNIGLYIKCLGKVIYKDIPRFLVVFTVLLVTFSTSFYIAVRAHKGTSTETVLDDSTLRGEISCTTNMGCVMLAGIMTWLEGSSIVRDLSEVGWLGAVLIVLFMMSVTIILLNILIAQLSLTYELVQEESLNSFTALRMQAVAIVEWQSRFKFWNLRKKYYVPGELKTRAEVEEMMKEYRKSADLAPPIPQELWHIQERVNAMKANLNQEQRKTRSANLAESADLWFDFLTAFCEDTYLHCKDYLTAINIWESETLPVYRRELGDHPWTASNLHVIGDSYKELENADKAVRYLREALEMQKKVLGVHEDTARSHVCLSDVLRIQGEFKQALQELEEGLKIRKDVLGPDNDATIATRNKKEEVQRAVGPQEESHKTCCCYC